MQIYYEGFVVNRKDPDKLGRVRVRLHILHDGIKDDADLPWCRVMMPVTSASSGGVGSTHDLIEGSSVIVVFLDGDNKQNPMVVGTSNGRPEDREYDPNGIFPKHINESDVNRLSRNSKIVETSIGDINNNLVEVDSIGKRKWKEPRSAYNSEYPYNKVMETEGGHVEEFDSTSGAERYHMHQPSGNYVEMDKEGRKVEKIYSNNYEIVLGDDNIYIKGNCMLTIDGSLYTRIKGDKIEEIDGNFKQHVKGNYEAIVDKRYRRFVKENMYVVVSGVQHVWARLIDLNNWRRRRPQQDKL